MNLNFWPFKRKKTITFSEYVDSLADVDCGEKLTHYHWTISVGMSCPLCARNEEQRRKEEDEDRLARKIAQAILEANTKIEL
jgi:hypothetical protein